MINSADSASAAPVLLPLRTFLKLYSISKSEFYRLAARGEAPDLVKLGRRTLIPAASAAAWLASRVRPAIEISRAHGAAASANGDGIGSQVVSDQSRARLSFASDTR